MKTLVGILGIAAALAITGCEIERTVYVEDLAPTRPTGVTSITGDRAVYLYWDPNGERDLDFYRVYRGPESTGRFDFIGSTGSESFVDDSVWNGETYYYAVSAVDFAGYESELSVENVFDTPRPEGYDLTLFDFAVEPGLAAFDISRERRVAYDDADGDIWIDADVDLGVLFINAADLNTDLQDMGYTDNLDDIGWSPESGWSRVGWAQIIEGHTYVVWTRDNHYAKLRAVAVADTWARFDWAYQVDPGNPELVKPAHDSGYLTRPVTTQHGTSLESK